MVHRHSSHGAAVYREETNQAGRIRSVRASRHGFRKNKQMREGKKGGAQSGVDVGLSPSEEMLPIALVKYICIEVEVTQEKKSDHGRHQHDY